MLPSSMSLSQFAWHSRWEQPASSSLKETNVLPVMPPTQLMRSVNTHTHTHIYMHTHTHAHIYICIHTHTHTYIYAYTHTHTHTHIYIYIYIYIQVPFSKGNCLEEKHIFLKNFYSINANSALFEFGLYQKLIQSWKKYSFGGYSTWQQIKQCSMLEQRPVIEFLMAEKCKP